MAAANTDVETEYWVKRLASGWRSATLGNADLVKAQYVQLGQVSIWNRLQTRPLIRQRNYNPG